MDHKEGKQKENTYKEISKKKNTKKVESLVILSCAITIMN